ncbi:MAG TPA: hypothetical protein VND64_12475, partial [Pirellulales bacterium]|nr:hypothetical protein [Pirellulales bacterium]
SSTTNHNEHFAEQVKGGKLWSSTYIRMEFIRRWFCDIVRVALTIDQCDDVANALIILEQDFKPRNVKGTLAAISHLLRETEAITNARTSAEEVAAHAIRWLKRFDRVFPSRVANHCKCQIGEKTPNVDYNHLLEDLRDFYETFVTPVTDCEVNAFLGFGKAHSRAEALLKDDDVRKLSVGQRLAALAQHKKWITCKECSSIGDAIIAIEQPPSWSLVHLDKSFNALCQGRPHKQIKSATAIEKEP